MNDDKDRALVLDYSTKFEKYFVRYFGCQKGIGLARMVGIVGEDLPAAITSKLNRLIKLRNLVAHEHKHIPFKTEDDRLKFINTYDELDRDLMRTINSSYTRTDDRAADELRPVRITPGFLPNAEGSALIEMGNTRVICAASVEDKLPPHLRGQRTEGWVTAEYAMLPRSTETRTSRETGRGGPSGRTHEIQRLIGRSLRATSNRKVLGDRTITLDCDVLQADGGTRTAAITGAYVAFAIACKRLMKERRITKSPIIGEVAAVSVGIVDGTPLLDLKYDEDSRAQVDMNIVCTGDGRFIEVQGTAEGSPFTRAEMDNLLELGRKGIEQLVRLQRQAIEQAQI